MLCERGERERAVERDGLGVEVREVEREPEPWNIVAEPRDEFRTGAIHPKVRLDAELEPGPSRLVHAPGELLYEASHAPGGSSAHVTPGRIVTPGAPISVAMRMAATNASRRSRRWASSRWFGAILHRRADRDEQVGRSKFVRLQRGIDPGRHGARVGRQLEASPMKSPTSTSSNPSIPTMPMRSCRPATAGKQKSPQEAAR